MPYRYYAFEYENLFGRKVSEEGNLNSIRDTAPAVSSYGKEIGERMRRRLKERERKLFLKYGESVPILIHIYDLIFIVTRTPTKLLRGLLDQKSKLHERNRSYVCGKQPAAYTYCNVTNESHH